MSQSNQELLAEITQLQHGLANSQAKIAKLEASLHGNPVAAWVGYQNGEANRDRVQGFEPNNQTVLQYRDKSSTELFHATFEQAAVGVTHNDLQGRWLRVNHRFCAMIGYRKEELLSKTFMEITHPDDVASDVKLIQQTLIGEIQTYTLNKRYFHKNGEIVWVNLTVSLIRDALGMPDYFVVVIEDITKLKLAEQALLQSEERYRRIVEDQSDVICRFQADFEMTFVNQAFSTVLYGKRPDELVGLNLLNLVSNDFQQQLIHQVYALHPSQSVTSVEVLMRLANGTLRWFQWTTRLIMDEMSGITEYQAVGHDTTERRQAEETVREQHHFSEALRESLATLTASLDVNTVMQQILNYAVTVVPCDAGSIILFENSVGRIAFTYGYDAAAIEFFEDYRLSSAFFQRMLDERKPFIVEDTRASNEWIHVAAVDWIRSSIGIPIVIRGELLGALGVDSANVGNFRQDDIAKLQDFARYASLALENAYHVSHLEERVEERTKELQVAQQQLQFYANLQEVVSDAVVTVDLENRIQSWNKAAERMYGWQAEEVLGQDILKLLHVAMTDSADLEITKSALWKQGYAQNESINRRKDGSLLHVLSASNLLTNDKDVPYGFVTVIHDISERKRAEEKLQAYAAEVHDLYNNAPCGYHSLDQNGLFVEMNETELGWLGYSREEVIGVLKFADIATAKSIETFRTRYPTLKKNGWIKDIELEMVRKDGTIITLLLSSTAIYDEQGNFVKSHSGLYDISALKAAQEDLNRQHDFLQAVINAVPNFITVKDLNGRYELVNKRCADFHGVTESNMIGKLESELYPDPTAAAKFRQEDQEIAKTGQPLFIAERILGDLYLSTNVIPLKNNQGQVERILVVSNDITDRKRAEMALSEQRDLLQLVISSAPNPIVVKDQAGRFELANQHAAQIFGLTQAEMIGKTDAEINSNPAEVALFAQRDHIVRASGKSLFIPENEQGAHYFQTNITPLKNARGQFDRVLIMSNDITQRKKAELVASEQRDLLQLVIDSVPNPIFVKDQAGRFELTNKYAAQLYGLTPAEMIGKRHADVHLHSVDVALFAQQDHSVLASGKALFVPESKLGEYYFQSNVIPLKNPKGEFDRVLVMNHDITQRKKAEIAAREERDFLQQVIDNVPDFIVVKDRQGRYELANRRAGQLYGVTSAAMVGMSEKDVHPNREDALVFEQQDRQVLATGQPIFVSEEILQDQYFQTSVIPLKNLAGQYTRVLVVASDISQRKEAEVALSEQRDFLQLIINNLPDVILVKDQEGRFEMVNERAAQINQTTRAAMVGKMDAELMPNASDVAFYREKDREAIASGKPLLIQEEMILDRFYQTRKVPLRNAAGKYDRILVVSSDITEHKQAEATLEQALQKEKELSDLRSRFVSMTSHEFRTPLTAIMISAETLSAYRHKLSDQQIDKRLSKIQEQVYYLKDVMEDMLSLSSLQAQRSDFDPTVFDLNLLCCNIMDELKSELDRTNPILYHCDQALNEVKLDKKLLRHILNNLLSNALKYSPDNASVTLNLQKRERQLMIQVSDQGIGIPEADLKHLFEPFHRANNVGIIAGTGLGLTITKESIELHGGTIGVESQIGSGTTFIVHIPISDEGDEKYAQNSSH